MITLYIIGFLAFCYLIAGRAGFMAFWMFMRWPTTILFGLCAIADFYPFGLNPFLLTIISGLFAAYWEKLPDAFWDFINLIMYLAVAGTILFLLAELGLIT